MARVNIDDDVEAKEEFWKLLSIVKDRDAALGKLVRFFRIAQSRFGKGTVMTTEELDEAGLRCMIESGWAVEKGKGYKAKGAEHYFAWYKQKLQAGSKGGRPKAKQDNRPVISGNRNEPDENPLVPVPALVLAPDNINTNTVARTRFDFESLYRKYPLKKGKSAGLKKCKAQIKTQERYDELSQAIDRYKSYLVASKTEPRFIQQFATFMGAWTDWLDDDAGAVNFSGGKTTGPRAMTDAEAMAKAESIKQRQLELIANRAGRAANE